MQCILLTPVHFLRRLLQSLVLQEMPTGMSLSGQGTKQLLDSSRGPFHSVYIFKKSLAINDIPVKKHQYHSQSK